MKVAAITILLLPLAQGALFRAAPAPTTTTKSKAQVVVHGVKSAFTDADLAIINEAAITAYNSVQKDSTLTQAKPILHFGLNDATLKGCNGCPPDDDSFVADLLKGCNGCPPDDDYLQGCNGCPPDDDVAKNVKSANALILDVEISNTLKGCNGCPPDDDVVSTSAIDHKAFAKTFCGLLAKSGSTNLAHAKQCVVSFDELAPRKTIKAEDQSMGFLSVKGLLHDLTVEDLAIVEKATIATYNQAFGSAGNSIESFHARGAVETPKSDKSLLHGCNGCPPDDDFLAKLGGCNGCPPDDDSVSHLSHGVANIVIFDAKLGGCNGCPPDDDTTNVAVSSDKVNEAFSHALCSKLRNSGSVNLAFADGCSLDFFYEHVDMEKSS